jgi:hypothetical protein
MHFGGDVFSDMTVLLGRWITRVDQATWGTWCGETLSLRLSLGELEELANDQPGSATRAS